MSTEKFWLSLKAKFAQIDEPLEALHAEMGMWTDDDIGVLPEVAGQRFWRLTGGDDQTRTSFEALAVEGAVALGYSREEWPGWLWAIRSNRTWGDYRLVWNPTGRAVGEIPDALVASMRLCTELAPGPAHRPPVHEAKQRRMLVADELRRRGLTVENWCARAEVSKTVGYDYLSGQHYPRFVARQALAEVLQLPSLPR